MVSVATAVLSLGGGGKSNEKTANAVASEDAIVTCMYDAPAESMLAAHTRLVLLLQLDVPHAMPASMAFAVESVRQKLSPAVVTV